MDGVICIVEDRESCEPGLRILIASLRHHMPCARIEVICTHASAGFVRWLERFPLVELVTEPVAGNWKTWDVKAQALLSLLERGYRQVVWIDSDVVVCRDFTGLLANLPQHAIAVAEERLDARPRDTTSRTLAWNLPLGRSLPFVANTAVLRVTQAHVPLLRRWMELMASDAYRAAATKPWQERPSHLLGDQDVLSALLSSAEFAHLDVAYLLRGKHVLQYFGSLGYTTRERLADLFTGPPTFVHAQGWKPWFGLASAQRAASLGERFRFLYTDLSPFSHAAKRYAAELTSTQWLRPRSRTIAFFRAIGGDHAPLVGLPLAMLSDLKHTAQKLARARRRGPA